ncbi:MAG: primosomal protein N' [Pelatocladus maniniholoensis HA4357-MV3]|jgi:primosomal protein N' (replication factor Y)|uniref:Replication restart protein PriA n=1 Tax=Pelatocladus maniniholoensis HA4357-MV3 TaxID=1117104 RepID=A0A9E3HAU1_9NOST|nr:primosomal protein N' [Pelatocladus maniniholoensis HA4357-MV3]
MYINDVNLPPLVVAQSGQSYDVGINKNQWVEVLVDFPGITKEDGTAQQQEEKLYTYRLPPGLEVKPGDILSVPFGRQQVGGIAIRLLAQPPTNLAAENIRDVEDIIHSKFFQPSYWQLLERVSDYYYTPFIQVIRTALPPGLLGRSHSRLRLKRENIPYGADEFLSLPARELLKILQSQAEGDYSFKFLRRQIKGFDRAKKQLIQRSWVETYMELPKYSKPQTKLIVTLTVSVPPIDLSKRQREILEVLKRHGGELWLNEFLQICNTTTPTLKKLEDQGCIVIQQREILRSENGPTVAADQPKSLNAAQFQALSTIKEIKGYAILLLHGVTGSGKTEVYLQAIAPLLAQGKSALVLVPEIGLTPQLTDRFRARFGNKINVYHSALSAGERYDTWRQMLTGEPQVVIGTRSAVFAPLPNLGLIILDEEHDNSFKQDSPIPTYHARTVAQWRAELENCPLLLGSATPSLESWVRVRDRGAGSGERGLGSGERRFGQGGQGSNFSSHTPHTPHTPHTSHYLSLPERIHSRPLPSVEIVDMRQELQQGNRSIFSRSLQDALQQLKQRNQQGILFIHRRGHSTFVSCRNCGYVLECPHCDVSLSYHQTEAEGPQILRCHYCNYARSHPKNCPECSSPYLKFFGSGTQRVAQELTKQFPELRFIRFDSDTTRTKGAHRTLITQFANGEADLLIGTQMLTKGLDLPQVTLVGVVAADGLLYLSDYRASERAFQTLAQVAGRAGRGEEPGRVIVQTYTPEHPVIETVQNHDYQSFTNTELEQRQALNYPPYGRLILLRLSSLDPIEVQNVAQLIAAALPQQQGLDLLGPAPANILRVANRYRWQILLKFAPNALPQLPDWEQVRQLCPASVSLTIDIDPINMM